MAVPRAPAGNKYYEVRAIPGKGYGCVAIQQLKRGTRILEDVSLLLVPIAHYLESDIAKVYETLPPAEKDLYFNLASNHGQDPKKWPSRIHPTVGGRELQRIQEQHHSRVSKEPSLISIFQTNCMEVGEGAAVFPNAARFNHCCNPNAMFTWNPAIQKETIHIIHNVEKGEEITLSYCDMIHGKAARAYEFKHYGFVCDCLACTGDENDPDTFAHKSAQRRFRMTELNQATKYLRGSHLETGVKQPRFVEQLLELASLYNEEGYYSVRLAITYLELALICEGTGDFANGKTCAANALRVKRECQGEDFPDYEEYKEVLIRLNNKYKAER